MLKTFLLLIIVQVVLSCNPAEMEVEKLKAPVVSSISPIVSPTWGGNRLTFHGDNFYGATTIFIDGVPCLGFKYHSSKVISCLAPKKPNGAMPEIVVSNENLQITLIDKITYSNTHFDKSSLFAGELNYTGDFNSDRLNSLFDSIFDMDSDENFLYLSDCQNYSIKRIHLNSGIVSTIAGKGYDGNADGYFGANEIGCAESITVVGDKLFILDSSHHTIRELNLNNLQLTTVAGQYNTSGSADGIASTATFNYPIDAVSDGTFLYIADAQNALIRKMNLSTYEVTTVVSTNLVWPWSLAIDSAHQNLYLVDESSELKQIALSNFSVSTLSTDIAHPGRITTDGSQYLYLTDSWDNDGMCTGMIKRVHMQTGYTETLAGNDTCEPTPNGLGPIQSANFGEAYAIHFNENFGLFVSDGVNWQQSAIKIIH